MSEHEQAERLATSLDWWVNNSDSGADVTMQESARELRRLHNEVLDLKKALAASQQSVQYHPCTSILIQGLNELKGGSAVLQRWDEARLLADAKLTK